MTLKIREIIEEGLKYPHGRPIKLTRADYKPWKPKNQEPTGPVKEIKHERGHKERK